MSKLFKGNVSIVDGKRKDGTLDIRLEGDANGAFNSENASDLLVKAIELSKAEKLPLNTWHFYVPPEKRVIKASDLKLVADGKYNAVLQADFYGKPKINLLPPQAGKTSSNGWKKRKLA
tara:strand:+ start:217 stop:573 length:357 start_codon:yes stop_codon:yes gene_type:complete